MSESHIRKIRSLHKEMKDLILRTGIQEPKYDAIVKNLKIRKLEELIELKTYMKLLRSGTYADLKRLWNELPPEVWERYETHLGLFDALPEQKSLRKLQRELRIFWSQRPRYGKPHSDKEVPSNVHLQSENPRSDEDHSGHRES